MEVMEALGTTMFFERIEAVTDSGGAGRHRGGVGLHREIRFARRGRPHHRGEEDAVEAAWALAGGHEPDPNTFVVYPGTERERRVSTKRHAGLVRATASA